MDYIEFSEIDSTNEYIKQHLETLEHLSVVRTNYQTKGKGRGGHIWDSTKGTNLLMSILLKELDEDIQVHQITQVIACAIVEALKCYDIEAFIKWPNDIYVQDLKICGILVEAIYKDRLQGIVIGVGLNVNEKGKYQSMANSKGIIFDIKEVMVRILTQFTLYYTMYVQGSYQCILEKANRLSYLKNRYIKYQEYGVVRFEELLIDGRVVLKDSNNHYHKIYVNEISLHEEKVIT